MVAIWGTNFVIIRLGLQSLPPLLFASLRFCLALAPAVFFLKRPAVSWSNLALYGLFGGAGQFGLLFLAMKGHISPGLASLVIQMQVFFTIGISIPFGNERPRLFQMAALALGAAGIGIIAAHTDLTTTPLGLALVLAAALCWAVANILVKRSGASNILAYVVWASLFAAPPLFLLSLATEGWSAIAGGLAEAGWTTWVAVAWQAVGNTLFGFAAWGWLLTRYPAASVTPLALLVPIFGMGASTLLLSEALPFWKVAAAALVLSGLALNVAYPRLRTR